MTGSYDRVTVNLTADDVELDVDELDRLVERSECTSRSELVRRLIAAEIDADDADE